jgi:hypothetical protein
MEIDLQQTKTLEMSERLGPASTPRVPSQLAHTLSWTDLLYHAIGSVLFTVGALGFVLSATAYVQSWLGPFQLGALCWIVGSVAYLVPLLSLCRSPRRRGPDPAEGADEGVREERSRRWPWGVGEIGSALCLLCFIVGCSIVFFGPDGLATEAQAIQNLPAMNGLFTAGSAVLFANPLYALLLSCLASRRRSEGSPTKPSTSHSAPAPSPTASVDWWFEVAVAACFTYAGAAGGYGLDRDTVTSGMACWVAGSAVLLVQAAWLAAAKSRAAAASVRREEVKSTRLEPEEKERSLHRPTEPALREGASPV